MGAETGVTTEDPPENVNRTESDTADQLKEVSEELVPSESGTNPSGTVQMGAETSVTTEDTPENVNRTESDMDTTEIATSEPVKDRHPAQNIHLLVNASDELKKPETSSNTENTINESDNKNTLDSIHVSDSLYLTGN